MRRSVGQSKISCLERKSVGDEDVPLNVCDIRNDNIRSEDMQDNVRVFSL